MNERTKERKNIGMKHKFFFLLSVRCAASQPASHPFLVLREEGKGGGELGVKHINRNIYCLLGSVSDSDCLFSPYFFFFFFFVFVFVFVLVEERRRGGAVPYVTSPSPLY